ncbi:MAG TPA: hotdog fold domain-containing protein [Gemmatimonadales bacterium]|nr:hotdog fold domain-containing protein [Gemmatimonadales bacterium]
MSPTRLLDLWRRLGRTAPGRWVFSKLVGLAVPYSGSIGARVVSLEPGRAVLTLRDRRAVRQHLGAVHAIALANLAELSSGMAMLSALPPGVRGIVTSISIRYHKKARGLLTATGEADPPAVSAQVEAPARAEIHDQAGELVAQATVTWLLDLKPVSGSTQG